MRKLLLVLSLACIGTANAAFLDDLHVRFPQTKDAVVKKAFGNFYSVVQGNEIVYINEDLSILINGEVLDLKSNRSLTAALREENRPRFAPSELRMSDAIHMGSGKRKIFVFSDPDCPYCRQLQSELGKLKDVSVYILPMPLTDLHPGAAATAQSIWCAPDRAASWNAYLLQGVKPDTHTCDNPLERNLALARKYRVLGTPAIVFEDGSVIPGAVPATVIETRLATFAKK